MADAINIFNREKVVHEKVSQEQAILNAIEALQGILEDKEAPEVKDVLILVQYEGEDYTNAVDMIVTPGIYLNIFQWTGALDYVKDTLKSYMAELYYGDE